MGINGGGIFTCEDPECDTCLSDCGMVKVEETLPLQGDYQLGYSEGFKAGFQAAKELL